MLVSVRVATAIHVGECVHPYVLVNTYRTAIRVGECEGGYSHTLVCTAIRVGECEGGYSHTCWCIQPLVLVSEYSHVLVSAYSHICW